ncbi:hypothetical protein CK203_073424 [Vitis vinifera]|uniref:Uncharacterized protein n=1 Tax=Vitis vinifera TaxID=29760 RepID=A0A438EK39_VITVI|nr:hypothetical protein CK203_073424 [Vitis vinifera]
MLPLRILLGGSRYHQWKYLLGGSKPILGDTLVVAGTLFLAMSNVGEEFCVKKKDSVEVVAMIVLLDCYYIMEFETLKSIKWSPDIVSQFPSLGLSKVELLFFRQLFLSFNQFLASMKILFSSFKEKGCIWMDLYLRETVFTKQCIDLKWLPCSEAFCQKDPMLLLSNKSILDTAQWSHNAQSFSSYIRFVGSGYSRLFLPPEGITLQLQVDWLYYLSFATITIGLIIYSKELHYISSDAYVLSCNSEGVPIYRFLRIKTSMHNTKSSMKGVQDVRMKLLHEDMIYYLDRDEVVAANKMYVLPVAARSSFLERFNFSSRGCGSLSSEMADHLLFG